MDFEDLEGQRKQGLEAAAKSRGRSGGEMTLRERFQRAMHYQHVDPLPNFEFGYWDGTLTRWHKQGLPETVVDEKTAYQYFGIETFHTAPIDTGIRSFLKPVTLSEKDGKRVYRDEMGITAEINIGGDRSIPHFLEFPIKDRKTWEPYKEALLDQQNRYPENWSELAEKYRQRDYPLGIWFGSMIGTARNLIGFENIALMVCEEPELMEEIVETFCQCSLNAMERGLRDVQFDFGAGWEDICFNSGPIVGVPFFRNVVTPRYKRITHLLRRHGIDVIFTDCDGNLSHIVPCFLEGGINTMFPVEVHGGTDPVALRRKYGKDLLFWGGVDKMIFLKDKAAVDAELERLRPHVEEGGFIPTMDHRVQSDASLDLYKYYLDRKRVLFHVGGNPTY